MIDEEFDALDRDVEAELRHYDEITALLLTE
jgi:hypothetical protein